MEKNKLDFILENTGNRLDNLKSLQQKITSLVSQIQSLQDQFYSEEKEINEKLTALTYLFKEDLKKSEESNFDPFNAGKTKIDNNVRTSVLSDEAIQNISDKLHNINKINLNYKLNSLPNKPKEKTKKI